MTYRKVKNIDTWHICTNCSKWPVSDYEERANIPAGGEFCNECKLKLLESKCFLY